MILSARDTDTRPKRSSYLNMIKNGGGNIGMQIDETFALEQLGQRTDRRSQFGSGVADHRDRLVRLASFQTLDANKR